MIRIILVEDHALVSDGVRRLLEEAVDVRVVGTFADGSELIVKLHEPASEHSARAAPRDQLERLSAREMEVLKLVVEGNTSAEVAARLGLSPKSIDTYRSRLMTKLEVPHLAGLVKFAIRRGITSP